MKVLKRKTEIYQTNRAQTVNEKNGVIGLVTMFTPRVTVIKMSKIADIFYSLLMAPKNQSQFGQSISVHLKDLIAFFQKMVWLKDFGVTVVPC